MDKIRGVEGESLEKSNDSSIKISKTKIWQGLAILFFLTTVGLFFFPINSPTGNVVAEVNNEPEPTNDQQPQGVQPNEQGRFEVSEDDDPFLGDENAPIVIVAFEDFQCPFCKKVHDEAFPRLKTDYIDTGKVKYVFRDFPLVNIHPQAAPASLAAECANEQGKFWEYHDLLYANQASLSDELYERIAQELEMEMDTYNECYNSKKYASEVENDFNQGIQSGVDGTPAFFINGIKIVGSHPFSNFQEIIESELKN